MSKDADAQRRLQQMMNELKQSQPGSVDRSTSPSSPSSPVPTRSGKVHRLWRTQMLTPLAILAIPWIQEIIDQLFFQGQWNFILYPRSLEGLFGIFLSAFSHSGFAHLIANSIGFVIFSWLILFKSSRDFWITFLIGWVGGGLVDWLLAPQPVHGLSGVVYTLFGYLLVIGWLERRFIPLLISVFVFVNYSSVIWGIFPSQPLVAWWGHLFGLLLGIFAAFGVYREPAR
jgi:membrane associated rhomboid family serine protease